MENPTDRTIAQAAASSQIKPKRDLELWFEEGNLVVQAEDYQFCLFKSFLTKRSPIFKDTLSMPQPEGAERINGCPVVRIHDSGADAVHFFKAIFDPETFLPPQTGTTFEKIAAILRLSTKYEVEYLRQRALEHLSTGYSTSFLQWTIKTSATFTALPCDALDTIILARKVDCPWILPTAFYAYCRFANSSEIFRGTEKNGVLVSLSDADK
ncbi:hypothetical protein DFH07DRAFT_730644 [Mycena maculata]|uniref:BTB domain-containing protein n=1 Tax=Mycena maculata TaxID=230809 RepID=A0AAD7K7E4_9AGAR|nr:hypothetical protein DFH07DRAFT_730644 [Mycena maculata]